MSEIEKKWYVLRAISGKETKVKEYLELDQTGARSLRIDRAQRGRFGDLTLGSWDR